MRYNSIDRIIAESIRRVIREADEPVQGGVEAAPKINVEELLNNIPEPEDLGGRDCYKRDYSSFIAALNQRGSWDNRLYDNPAAIDDQIKKRFVPAFQQRAFRAARYRYIHLHKTYPDGMPVMSPEEKEERRLANKYRRNIEKGSYNDRLFWNGEKFIKYIEKNFPHNPWLVDVARKQLNWVDRVYGNKPDYEWPEFQSMSPPWK